MEYHSDNKGKRLFLELGTHVQLEIEGVKSSFKSELVGMEVGKYLILRLYQDYNNKGDLLKEKKIIAKYLHKHAILGFHSTVISVISTPENLLFLTYPEVIEDYNFRSEQRFECFFPIKIEIEYNLVEGAIIDINSDGCCCMVKDLKIINEQKPSIVTMFLKNRSMENEFALLGKVRSIRHKKDELHIGIMFDKMDSNTQTIIEDLFPTLEFQARMSI